MIIEEELREDAEIFQAYVEKPMMIMRRKEELRIAQEQQEKKDAEEKARKEEQERNRIVAENRRKAEAEAEAVRQLEQEGYRVGVRVECRDPPRWRRRA